MQKTAGAKQLRELRRNASAGAMLIRLFTPHVLEHGVEARIAAHDAQLGRGRFPNGPRSISTMARE